MLRPEHICDLTEASDMCHGMCVVFLWAYAGECPPSCASDEAHEMDCPLGCPSRMAHQSWLCHQGAKTADLLVTKHCLKMRMSGTFLRRPAALVLMYALVPAAEAMWRSMPAVPPAGSAGPQSQAGGAAPEPAASRAALGSPAGPAYMWTGSTRSLLPALRPGQSAQVPLQVCTAGVLGALRPSLELGSSAQLCSNVPSLSPCDPW